ncbi:MAG: GntR family transcriptional regulator [Peptococcaceae bacterium]|nr:GntR family transcriptional regulator [Peptococcaceae bacterium]
MKDLLEKYSGHLAVAGGHSPLITGDQSTTVQEQVYRKIRHNILSGVFDPGQRLLPDDLAAGMAVDPGCVREALLRLEGEGLVNFQPSRGFTVARFTLDDLKEIYFLRGLLEGAASELAAGNLTEKELDELASLCRKMEECVASQDLTDMPRHNAAFHEIIYRAARSPRLYSMIVKLWNGFLKSSLSTLTLRAEETVAEHRAIYEALRSRNPQEAGAKTREHIVSVLGDLSEYWKDWLTPVEEWKADNGRIE